MKNHNQKNLWLNIGSFLYDFSLKNNTTNLYYDINENSLALLYKSSIAEDGSKDISIYKPHFVYIVSEKNNTFQTVSYCSAKNYSLITKKLPNFINEFLGNQFCTPIIKNGHVVSEDKELQKNFKNSYKQYSILSSYIPAYYSLNGILDVINHHIATGDLNKNNLLNYYIILYELKDIFPDIYEKVVFFINNLDNINYQEFCDTMQHKLRNMKILIDSNLENEFEK